MFAFPNTTRSAIAISSTVQTFEGTQSEYCTAQAYLVQIASVAALAAGILKVEVYDPNSLAWVTAPQKISLVASGGGTPAAVNGNTASATLIVGGVAENCSGLTAITSTLTAVFSIAFCLGIKTRLSYSCTSGTAAGFVTFQGLRNE